MPSKTLASLILLLSLFQFRAHGESAPAGKIDRHALVTRHNITWNDATGQIPIGNGEFCFNADASGLETFGGLTLSHWGWHYFPLPAGITPDQVPPTGTLQKGHNTRAGDVFPKDQAALRAWLRVNPHILNLGRLSLCGSNGLEIAAADMSDVTRTMDLWSGVQTSTYKINGQPVRVQTCVDSGLDAVIVRIDSPLIKSGGLQVALDFPYPAVADSVWTSDYSHPALHKTDILDRTTSRVDLERTLDGTTYFTSLSWSSGATLSPATSSPHRFLLTAAGANRLSLVCDFSPDAKPAGLPSSKEAFDETATHWKDFWSTGGAIDLSGSKDPRWFELERRIVLSQYLTAAQSAGSYPPAESALSSIDRWGGHFHMEMVWWHLAHFALWDRWQMADKALGCYQRFIPVATELAQQLGYKGLKWPKGVGPDGRTMPWSGAEVLLWKEPHPIFFAELDYRLHLTRTTLEKWDRIVEGTADYMADYATLDPKTGLYSLDPDMPPSEQGITSNTVFDLAYWRWGLGQAQQWRQRLGLPPIALWDQVREHLAPLPQTGGVYVDSMEWLDPAKRRAWEHPDPIGPLGMLPPTGSIDPATAQRTVREVWTTWDWNRCWGWDFPWMAMAAARTGQPDIAIEALLKDCSRNHYDERGANTGGSDPYLPGNGGLLYAVAMMAAGWDGAPARHAPGFPDNGQWNVRWENLEPAP
jgi:hypothetical protein